MYFQEVNTQQLMELRQAQGLEGDFGQVNWHLTETQGAKLLEKLSSCIDFNIDLYDSLRIFFVHVFNLVIGFTWKARKYWSTLALRCVRLFKDRRPNFANHPKSLQCIGKRRTKASSVRHHKWVEGIPTINCSTLFLSHPFFPKIWPTNVTATKIIMFNCKFT